MTLMSMLATVVVSAAVVVGSGSAGAAEVQARAMTISLTGEAEGPGLGDPDGSGTAQLRIDPDQGQFCYVLTVADIVPARLAHIHQSPVGEAGGPIVVSMDAPTDGSSEGCTAISPDLARALLASPADYYVNVHNADYPGGAVRGQLG